MIFQRGDRLDLSAQVEPPGEVCKQILDGVHAQFGQLGRPRWADPLDVLHRSVEFHRCHSRAIVAGSYLDGK